MYYILLCRMWVLWEKNHLKVSLDKGITYIQNEWLKPLLIKNLYFFAQDLHQGTNYIVNIGNIYQIYTIYRIST